MVLCAEAEVDQAPTVYVFTEQGSQSTGMDMASYRSSPATRMVWDDAVQFLVAKFGKLYLTLLIPDSPFFANVNCYVRWPVLDFVQNNPKLLMVYFGGQCGKQVRSNYMAMTIDPYCPDGKIIKDLTSESMPYTFSDPRGLLFSTQFAQPIITLLEQAA
jgi:fatty acid synthase subunit beta